MLPNPDPFGPPWHTATLWREVNATLALLLERHRAAMEGCYELSDLLKQRLEALFPRMDELCRTTCRHCSAPCCYTALVWFDFKDLLFLHLAGLSVPTSQPLYPHRRHCRFLTPAGCRLPRLNRPWLCTWYVCPPQIAILRDRRRSLNNRLSDIKVLRGEMEHTFIRLIV